MKHYSNISGASGVESYDYDSAFTYLVVKFKDGSILAFPSRLNSIDQIRSMCVFADMGVGLHRYINKN